MGKLCKSDDDNRHLFSLTSLQIGDLQSYLSGLSLFLARDSKTFYVLVDNRPWLKDLVSRPAHLWQLMVTKSRMSPFAIRQTQKDRKDSPEFSELKFCPETPTPSESLRKWFLVIDAATLSKKRAFLPIEKLKSSLLDNSKLHRTLYGFIVFEVLWNDVRGINYLNELQTDTSLALEVKYMRRWEFDSIAQAAKCITSWFPGTQRERLLLEDQLSSMLGDVFHDAPNCHGTDADKSMLNGNLCNTNIDEETEVSEDEVSITGVVPNCHGTDADKSILNGTLCYTSIDEETEVSEDKVSITDSPPDDVSNKRKRSVDFLGMDIRAGSDHEDAHSESAASDYAEVAEPTEYRDVLLLFRFNDHDLPFELQDIIMSDLRLLTLLEAGLPSWVIFCQSYPVFCHIYRPWMCPLARVLYVAISLVTVVIGFYDLYKNIPLLKATAARLCGPLFGWIETWEMVSRIKYLGTMLFLHNSKKAVKWFLMTTRTAWSFFSVLAQPYSQPFMVVFEVFLPIWNMYIQMVDYFCSFIWILMATSWKLAENLIEIILLPLYFILSIVWRIAKVIVYPVFWLLWGMLYAPIRLVLGLSNFVGFTFNHMYELIGGMWLFMSGLFKLASDAEETVGTYQVSMWRTLWNDLFSQIFRAVRSILNGFVAFAAACNRHRLSIYNHLREFIARLYQPTQRSHFLSSIQRAKKSGSETLAEVREQSGPLLTKNMKHS